MGQKTNPNILRLGVTQKWKTEFFEKKKKELPLYVYKDLEIQNYLERFLDLKKVFVQDYSQYYSDNTLNLYISYFVPAQNSFNTQENNKKICLISPSGENKKFVFFNRSDLVPKLSVSKKSLRVKNNIIERKELYMLKKYFRFNKIKNFTYSSNQNLFENSLERIFKVISSFTANTFNIKVTFSCINKNLNYLNLLKDKKIKVLQKFKSAPFFKSGLELLFHVTFNKDSARLLAKFIAVQLEQTNRPNFFLSFIKNTLSVLMSSKLSKLKGIKIILKGRLTKGPRAKQKTIIIGDVAVQSLNCNINYFQTTTHNANGSYGIKVWIVDK